MAARKRELERFFKGLDDERTHQLSAIAVEITRDSTRFFANDTGKDFPPEKTEAYRRRITEENLLPAAKATEFIDLVKMIALLQYLGSRGADEPQL